MEEYVSQFYSKTFYSLGELERITAGVDKRPTEREEKKLLVQINTDFGTIKK